MAYARQVQIVIIFFAIVLCYYLFTYSNQLQRTSKKVDEIKTTMSWYVQKNCSCTIYDSEIEAALGVNSTTSTCPMTVNVIGRLGNMMGEYATLFALSRLNGRLAYQQESMSEQLGEYFNLSMPVLSADICDRINWNRKFIPDWMLEEYSNLECSYLYIVGYPCSWTFYHHIREQIKKEFTFKSDIIVKVQTQLWKYRGERKSVTFVGIHVRRGDYVYLMQNSYDGVLADDEYFEKATNYFRERHPDSIFIVCSDDLDWCKKNINSSGGDVYFGWDGEGSSAGHDMALLTQCNHTIMSMGTFGYWSAYLTGGQVVYLNNFTRHGSKFNDVFHYDAAYLPEWHGINANLNSTKWI